MALIVHSPHDGQEVKVRDQDLQRAIRDSEGRIFYAVKRSDGQGYYGSFTRKGSDKDEQRYLEMLEKTQKARETGAERSAQQIHDATGRPAGPGVMRWLLLLVLAALIAAVTWYFVRPDNPAGVDRDQPGQPQAPSATEPSSRGVDTDIDAWLVSHTSMQAEASSRAHFIGTSSGLHYSILRPGTGEVASAGRYVRINYTAKTLSGEVIDGSAPETPAGFVLWSGRVPRGWDEGVAGMRVGEKRRVVLPLKLMTGPYPGEVVLPDLPLIFDIELVDVLRGIRTVTDEPGRGVVARPGDTVRVHYKAFISQDQTAYDDTYQRGKPAEYRIGTGEVIQGWELGVVGMAEGETRTIEIPSYLGYGPRGAAGVIPPDSNLRYTIELLKVIGPATRHNDISLAHSE